MSEPTSKAGAETPLGKLATVLLDQPVADWINSERDRGSTWRQIARKLRIDTEGTIDVMEQTVRNWAADPVEQDTAA